MVLIPWRRRGPDRSTDGRQTAHRLCVARTVPGYGERVSDHEHGEDPALADWELIRRVVVRVRQRITAQMSESGLPEPSFEVLHILLNAPDHRMPMTYLARRVSMTSGGFTKLADRLGRAGLVDRRSAEHDRRLVYASLTDEGVRLARQSQQSYRSALDDEVLSLVSAEHLHAAAEALRPLDESAAPPPLAPTPVRRGPRPERRRAQDQSPRRASV